MTKPTGSHSADASALPSKASTVEVFYDGSCPLCIREIGFYQRCNGADAINWVDVSDPQNADVLADLDREDAMARFHIRSSDGALISGAEAFAGLWKALPGWRGAGNIAGAWGIRHVLEVGYRGFLIFRPALQRFAGWLERAKAGRAQTDTK